MNGSQKSRAEKKMSTNSNHAARSATVTSHNVNFVMGAVVTALALMALGKPVHAADMQALPAQDAAIVRETCIDIVGAEKGTALYQGCTDSLSQTVRSQRRAATLSRSSNDCEKAGPKHDTAAFSTCVLRDRDAYISAHDRQLAAAVISKTPVDVPTELLGRSFIESTPASRHRKKEYACAQLGLSPDSDSFGQCVADLEAALDPLLRPSG
ncbi:MAG: hypothetical protein KGM97_04230 [Alphaproteobacteria bacterium]|nr:hypothetical protein [Alphaproteobacteria bacterium]MDE2630181.1 hypothetical protein [Alphaproteobacteria bacterium]